MKMMGVNKEEAERCIEYAGRFILDGKKDKAEKFLLKAERLFPTQKAKGKPSLLHFFVACLFCLSEQRLFKSFVRKCYFVQNGADRGEHIKH
jgi:hypothetical protein